MIFTLQERQYDQFSTDLKVCFQPLPLQLPNEYEGGHSVKSLNKSKYIASTFLSSSTEEVILSQKAISSIEHALPVLTVFDCLLVLHVPGSGLQGTHSLSCPGSGARLTSQLFSWFSFLPFLKHIISVFFGSCEPTPTVHFCIESGHTVTSANSFGTLECSPCSPSYLNKYTLFCWWVSNHLLPHCQLPISFPNCSGTCRGLEAGFSVFPVSGLPTPFISEPTFSLNFLLYWHYL